MHHLVELADDRIRLPGCALPASPAPADTDPPGPTSTITPADIRDADLTATPPELRTLAGQTLFVSAADRYDLARFCQENRIPLCRRADIWADLLLPFLDTALPPRMEAGALKRLDAAGLPPAEVLRIRDLVAPLMRAYSGWAWDWAHLGLFDLLEAAADPRFAELVPAQFGGYDRLRDWAMRIAEQGMPR
jgi:hypothetical protein